MTGREQLDYREKRIYLRNRAGGICEVCGKLIGWDFEWAHRLPQDDIYLSRYGKAIIHHPLNAAAVCRGGDCNSKVSMRQHPIAEKELVARIKNALEAENGRI